MLRPGLGAVLVCACLGERVRRIQWAVHMCMRVWVSLGEQVWGAPSLPSRILHAGGVASLPRKAELCPAKSLSSPSGGTG